jgi:hypothetical protein
MHRSRSRAAPTAATNSRSASPNHRHRAHSANPLPGAGAGAWVSDNRSSNEDPKMKKRSEYTALEWARLYPEQRYAAMQAENDEAAGRNIMPVRAEDGRGVNYIDKATGKQVAGTPDRRIGGLV